MKLLIFDIDGTLTHLDGSTYRAFARAFRDSFDTDLITEGLKLHGRTDPVIFKECFGRAGLTGGWQAAYGIFKKAYIQYLPDAISSNPKARVQLGIPSLLDALRNRKTQCALALGTGNGEAGARAKIGYFGLNSYFPVGGFGDEHEERFLIMKDAIHASERHYDCEFNLNNIWVIGDTAHDVEGGKAIGVRTLAVATGGAYTYDDLLTTGADFVFQDLSNTTAVLAALSLE
jgi:phosphoglycolate phosphatase